MLETLRVAVIPNGVIVVTLTDPENPARDVTVTVEPLLEPAATGSVAGAEEIEKSGPTTVNETKVE